MKEFFKIMFATMAGIFAFTIISALIFFIFILILVAVVEPPKETVAKNSILHLQLSEEIKDRGLSDPFEQINFLSTDFEKSLSLQNVLNAIHKAKRDDNIKGILLEPSSVPSSITILEELREALSDFKQSGKFIISYSEFYDQKSYFLASLSDSIFLNPVGGIDFKGLSAQVVFLKGTLDKLEIQPEIIRHGKFKSAVEPFMQKSMSNENREQYKLLLDNIWAYYLNKISDSRKISPDILKKYADELSLFQPEKAVENKFVDALIYRDQLLSYLKSKLKIENDKDLKFITLKKYINTGGIDESSSSDNKIAIVYAQGDILTQGSGGEIISSDRFSKILRELRNDKNVKSVVLRVDSPGGDGVASDIINREIELIKKEKPVVVSMGKYAASGGYYISCNADKIVANNTTLTGSIGVFGLLFNTEKLFNNKLGITFDKVMTNQYSDFYSGVRPLSAFERKLIQNRVDVFYDTFLTRVSSGRKLSKESVDLIAQGRVWSGIEAKKIGLVDTLGGIELAIKIASDLAGIKDYRLKSYPPKEDFFEKVFQFLEDDLESRFSMKKFGKESEFLKILEKITRYKGIQTRMIFEPQLF